MKETLSLKGKWRIEIREKGKTVKTIELFNTLTNAYRQEILKNLQGTGESLSIKYIAVGTDSTPSEKTDTALGNEIFRSVPTSKTVGDGYMRTIWVLTNEQANDHLRELGVIIGNADGVSGILMSRVNIDINKNDSQEVVFIRDDFVRI